MEKMMLLKNRQQRQKNIQTIQRQLKSSAKNGDYSQLYTKYPRNTGIMSFRTCFGILPAVSPPEKPDICTKPKISAKAVKQFQGDNFNLFSVNFDINPQKTGAEKLPFLSKTVVLLQFLMNFNTFLP